MKNKEIAQALRCCASGESEEECPFTKKYECDGGILGGVYIYDTEEQAVEAWNRRVNDG